MEAAPKSNVMSMADIEGTDDVEYKKVQGFKDGQVIVIRSLSAGDMIAWSEANEGEAKRTAGLRLIVQSLVDGIPGEDYGATGKSIATDKDIKTFRTKSHKVSERIVKAILELNGINVSGDVVKKD